MFRLWDTLTQNYVSEENPWLCVFMEFCSGPGNQNKTTLNKKRFIILTGETEQTLGLVSPTDEENVIQWDLKGYRRDKLFLSLPIVLPLPSVVLSLQCNIRTVLWDRSVRDISSSCLLTSQVNRYVFWIWIKLCCVLQMSEYTWTYEAAFSIQARQGALLNSSSPGEVTSSVWVVGIVFIYVFVKGFSFFFFKYKLGSWDACHIG